MNAKEFDWSECPAVWRDPERMSGKWCFNKTRLPLDTLFGHLAFGSSIEEFIEWYPGVEHALIVEVLKFAAKMSASRLEPVLAA